MEESDQIRESSSSWLVEQINRIKQYIKKRPILKYGLIGAGGVACCGVFVVGYVYVQKKKTKTEFDGVVQEFSLKRIDPGVAKEVKDADVVELMPEIGIVKKMFKNLGMSEIQSAKRKESLDLKKIFSGVINNGKMITTTITPEMAYEDFDDIYTYKIYKNEVCKDILCGRCSACQWTNRGNIELYKLLVEAAEVLEEPVVLYDSVTPLVPMFKNSVEVYSNIEEVFMQALCKMMMVDDILFMRFSFTSLSNRNIEAIPMICTIFIERKNECFGYRFRLRNTIIPDFIYIEDLFKKLFKYSGYNLPTIVKTLATSISTLPKDKTLSIGFTFQPNERKDVFYSADPISVRRKSEMLSYLNSMESPVNNAIFVILVQQDQKEITLETITKYRCINFISQFGVEKKNIEFANILATLRTDPLKYAASALDTFRNWLGQVLRNKDKIKKNEEVGYVSETAHALTVFSSISAWDYMKDQQISIFLQVANGDIEYICVNGVKVSIIPDSEDIFEYFSFMRTGLAFSNSALGSFISKAMFHLKRAYMQKDKGMSIILTIEKEKAAGKIIVTGHENSKEEEESFGFLLPKSIYSALKVEKKDRWLFSLLKALVFSQYSISQSWLSVNSVEKELVFGNFILPIKNNDKKEDKKDKNNKKEEEEEKLDILDDVYARINNKENDEISYSLFILNDTIIVKLFERTDKKDGKKEKDKLYIHVDSILAEGLSAVLGGTFSYGTIKKKDFYGLIIQDLDFKKKLDNYDNIILVNPDFFYSRAYIMGRGIMNVLQNRTIGTLEMKEQSHEYAETFTSWLSSLGQFSSISLSHPFLYYIMDFKKGMKIDFKIQMIKKKVKSPAKTTCTIEVSSGKFKEEITLHYVELPKEPTENKVELSLRHLFAKILNLSPPPDDSSITISLVSLPISSSIEIVIKTTQYTTKHELIVDYDATKEIVEQLIKETEDLYKSSIPIVINGNISIPLAVVK